jgi:phosphoenolpyruvate carboxylase
MLQGLDHDGAISVVRAFSFFSQLANIAEDLHYFRAATPITEIAELNIGSRPAARGCTRCGPAWQVA